MMACKPHTTATAVIERDNKSLMLEELAHTKQVINQPAIKRFPVDMLINLS